MGMLGNVVECQGTLRNIMECCRMLGNVGDCQEMFRNDDIEIIFLEEDSDGRQEVRNVGNVGKDMHGNIGECLIMLGNDRECCRILGNDWEGQGMVTNDNVEIAFTKKRIGMEDRKVGMQGILGKVCQGMLGNVEECWGIMGNVRQGMLENICMGILQNVGIVR